MEYLSTDLVEEFRNLALISDLKSLIVIGI